MECCALLAARAMAALWCRSLQDFDTISAVASAPSIALRASAAEDKPDDFIPVDGGTLAGDKRYCRLCEMWTCP